MVAYVAVVNRVQGRALGRRLSIAVVIARNDRGVSRVLGFTLILHGSGDGRDADLAITAIKAFVPVRGLGGGRSLRFHFVLLLRAIFLRPLGRALTIVNVVVEWGGNAQQIVSYRDICPCPAAAEVVPKPPVNSNW